MTSETNSSRNRTSTKIGISAWVLFAVLFVIPSAAQNEKEHLLTDKNRIEKEIQYTTQLISETQQNRQASLNQLLLLNKQINQRLELIETVNNEVKAIDTVLAHSTDTIKNLEKRLVDMKKEYARMIQAAFKHRKAFDRLMFIFAADNFNQAYNRMKYFHQYGTYRRMQAERIMDVQLGLNQKIAQLEAQKAEKLKLKISYDNENRKLATEQILHSQTVKNLLQKEKDLLKTLRENERAVRRLQKAIEDIIAAEMLKKPGSARPNDEAASLGYSLTPAEVALSDDFSENKGKLPWPSMRGIIITSFGEHPHPVLKGIKTQNNGIDIATHKGAIARSVFDGKVSNVLTIPSLNNVVILKHGAFITVYSNLDQVFVSKGDDVKTRQDLGIVHTDDEQGQTRLHFEIWRAKELLDPEQWLIKNTFVAEQNQ